MVKSTGAEARCPGSSPGSALCWLNYLGQVSLGLSFFISKMMKIMLWCSWGFVRIKYVNMCKGQCLTQKKPSINVSYYYAELSQHYTDFNDFLLR